MARPVCLRVRFDLKTLMAVVFNGCNTVVDDKAQKSVSSAGVRKGTRVQASLLYLAAETFFAVGQEAS